MNLIDRFDDTAELFKRILKRDMEIQRCLSIEVSPASSPLDDLLHELYLSDTNEFFCVTTAGKRSALVKLDNKAILSLYTSLQKVTVPVMPQKEIVGLDGTTYCLHMEKFNCSISLEWWETGPEEWRELVKAVDGMIEEIERGERVKRKSVKKHDPR